MAVEISSGAGRRQSTLATINVTPLVDVMLVLLIIFMVTAPMLQQGVDVQLPEVKQAKGLPQAKEPLVVTVRKDGSLLVGEAAIPGVAKLTPVLLQALKRHDKDQVFLQADRDVPYGVVVQVMAAVQAAGVDKLAMVTQEPEK